MRYVQDPQPRSARGSVTIRRNHLDPTKASPAALSAAMGALGIVYGDIGTSPLYALRECFSGSYGVAPTVDNVLGILSLVFWAITWIVVFKYLIVLMRADNQGEGGIMALIALLTPASHGRRSIKPAHRTVIILGLFGAALLYGDGMITPAVSVLSAVEGLEIQAPIFRPFIIPVTVGILVALFLVQKKGTERVGMIFGPVMLLWFLSIALIAVPWIVHHPIVWEALNPMMAVRFFLRNGLHGILVLTAVVLCVTGAEALYADMGHFGPSPIRRAWFFVVFPALILNYFGQGALLLDQGGGAVANSFYALAPKSFLLPLIVLATLATVIASQALISGVFSMTLQAAELGFSPPFRVIHTSAESEGKIYIPKLNFFLLVCCVALVLGFRSSDRLTGAYGIAVTGTMAITSLLFYRVSRDRWRWPVWRAAGLAGLFLLVDGVLLLPNLVKILHGGWVPIVIAVAIFTLMTTWHAGHEALLKGLFERGEPLDEFMRRIAAEKPHRVPGVAVYISRHRDKAPGLLLYQLKNNQVLREKVVLLSVSFDHVPYAPPADHGRLESLGDGIFRVVSEFGFMESPRIDRIFGQLEGQLRGLLEVQGQLRGQFEGQAGAELGGHPVGHVFGDATFYVGRDVVLPFGPSPLARWRKILYAFLLRNIQPPSDALRIKPEQVVEIGVAVKI